MKAPGSMEAKKNREKKDETIILGMPAMEAAEVILLIVLLAAAMGAIFRERFLLVVLLFIIAVLIMDSHRRKRERDLLEDKLDRLILDRRDDLKKELDRKGHAG